MAFLDEELIWSIRTFIYDHFAQTTHAPSINETALRFDLTREEAASVFKELHQRHALFLAANMHDILMANPFSGVETTFRVHVNGKTYFANCAWDSLGIPAALHVDAEIEAFCSQSRASIRISVEDGKVSKSDVLTHFLVPFKHWYDDLIFT